MTLPPGARIDTKYDIWTPHATQQVALGMILELDDGTNRAFRYCENGATEIAKNLVIQAEALDAQALDVLQTGYTLSVGEKRFDLLITTANGISNGDLQGGTLLINQGTAATDEGDEYYISNNKWTTSDTVINIEIADFEGIRNAMAATSNVSFIKNRYRDVIVKPTTLTAEILGVTKTIVSANYFFWAQFRGPTSVIIDTGDTVVVGEPCGHIDGSGTAGSLGLVSTHATDLVVGHVIHAAAGADYGLVNLTNLG
jgi:hypothetical protein